MLEDFDEDAAERNQAYAGYPPSQFAWLYIVVDIRDLSLSKIGLTTQASPMQRFAPGRTYNPFLMPFTAYDLSKCTWGTSTKELQDIESYIHSRQYFGAPLRHLHSDMDSEWFRIHPQTAEEQIDFLLAKRGFSVDGKALRVIEPGRSNLGEVHIERMRKIKTIFRPDPLVFFQRAIESGIRQEELAGYISFLTQFHDHHPYRVYL